MVMRVHKIRDHSAAMLLSIARDPAISNNIACHEEVSKYILMVSCAHSLKYRLHFGSTEMRVSSA